MQIIKKITAKSVCGSLKKLAAGMVDGEKILVMLIFGFAQGLEYKKSTLPDAEEGDMNTMLIGQFKAKNILTKENFFAGELYLPPVVSNLLEMQIRAFANEEIKPGQSIIMTKGNIDFAFQLGIQADSKSGPGYVYFGQSLMPQPEDDPFKKLESRMSHNLLAGPGEVKDDLDRAIAQGMKKEQVKSEDPVKEAGDAPWKEI